MMKKVTIPSGNSFFTRMLMILLLGAGCLAQDAVNPCEILSETLNCSGPGLHGAEIDFKTIKLNGKRKNDPMVSVGEELIITTAIKYKKRAKAEITTTFNGGCPVRTETKRLKPEAAVTYTATLDGNSYSGSGTEFSVNAPLAIGSYPLVVTFNATAVNGCIDNVPLGETKTFVLDVIDGAFILGLDAVKTGTTTSVASGAYLCKGQGQELDLSVTFSDPLSALPFGANDIVWTVSPPDAGSFSGPSGANGDTVTWLQADDFVSGVEDDVVLTVNAPDMQPKSFYLTVFGVNSTSGVLTVNTTQTFPIEPSDILPANADLPTIVAALSANTDVGFGTATKLRTRTFTGSSPFNQLENEIFLPSEADQTNPSLQIIKKATFQQGSGGLEVEIEAGPVVGDVNITWEQDRPGGTRKILHREHMTVTSGTPADTVTIYKQGTTQEGPFYEIKGYSVTLEAKTASGSFNPGFPIWEITNTTNTPILPPTSGALFPLSNLAPGEYTVTAKIGNDPLEKDTFEIYVYQIDLDVDTTRNGVVDDADDPGENTWTSTAGAIVATNYDNDDAANTPNNPDSIFFAQDAINSVEDYFVNGADDKKDIAQLVIQQVGSVNNIQFFLKIHASDLKAIHIFEERIPGAVVLNTPGTNGVIPWSGWEFNKAESTDKIFDVTSLVRNQTHLDLGIEALFFPGFKMYSPSFTFDGEIDIELIAQSGTGNTSLIPGNFIASDAVKFRVAPLLLLPNHHEALDVYVSDKTYASDIRSKFGSYDRPTTPTGADQWFQDHVEIGFTGLPGRATHVTMRMPYDGNPIWPVEKLFKPNRAFFPMRNFIAYDGIKGAGDLGGNLELIPPSPEWPLGRVLVGNNMSTLFTDFLEAQGVGGLALQAPIDIVIDWLGVGHVDEVVNFTPGGDRGYKVVHADTYLAEELIKNGALDMPAPDASAPLFAGETYAHGTASHKIETAEKRFLFDGVAHGHIKCVKKSQINDGSTVTISDGANTVIFEFDKNGSHTSPNIDVNIDSASTATITRGILKAAIDAEITAGNLLLISHEDGTDGILLINQSAGSAGDADILETVSNNNFVVQGMDGGEDPGTNPNNGVDLSAPSPTEPWVAVRLYDETGQGQVATVINSGDGWLEIDTSGAKVFDTTSKLIWNPGDGDDGLYKYIGHYPLARFDPILPIDKSNKWMTEPDDTTKYLVVTETQLWFNGSPTLQFPAIWSVHELIEENELWTFNEEAQKDFIDPALAKIQTSMGNDGGSPYLRRETQTSGMRTLHYVDDHLEDDTDDDFLSVPVIYIGIRNMTFGGETYAGIFKGSGVAYTPGFSNFQPAEDDLIVFPKPFMPWVTPTTPTGSSPVDMFEFACSKLFDTDGSPGVTRAVFADVWNAYHRFDGEVHCGTNALRKLFDDSWWEMMP